MNSENNVSNHLIIHWVRHAESCSNYDGLNFLDKDVHQDRPLGFEELVSDQSLGPASNRRQGSASARVSSVPEENRRLGSAPSRASSVPVDNQKPGLASVSRASSVPESNRRPGSAPTMATSSTSSPRQSRASNIFTEIKAKFKYHPNLSFIGMQQAILLGSNFVKKEKNPYNIVFVSPTVRTIMTALMAFRGTDIKIYVIPYINENLNMASLVTMDYQNTPFSSKILKRQILFIKDWLEKNWIERFDDIEIMQKLIQLKNILIKNNEHSDLVKVIENLLNCKSRAGALNYGEIQMDKYIACFESYTKNTIRRINLFLKSDPDPEINQIIKFFEKIQDPNFIRGPPVDFTILERFENLKNQKVENNNIHLIHQDLRNPDMGKFYQEIIPYAFNNQLLLQGTKLKIICITHGSLMRGYFSKKYNTNISEIMNTQVFEEIFLMQIDSDSLYLRNISFTYDKYRPRPIRTSFHNFENLNADICRVESVKGIINYPLIDEKLTEKLVPLKKSRLSTRPEDIVSADVKFYFENRGRYLTEGKSIVTGGLSRQGLSPASGCLQEQGLTDYRHKYHKYKYKYLSLLS